jgi:hypothetical protein
MDAAYAAMPPPPPRNPTPVKAALGAPHFPPAPASPEGGLKSIAIADYKSDSDSDEDESRPRPQAAWADKACLKRSLRRQVSVGVGEGQPLATL